jgi:ribonuclease HI
MAKKKQKYYVVWKGTRPGIYDNWEEAKSQIFGFLGAQYKSFETIPEAQQAYKNGYYASIQKDKETIAKSPKITNKTINYNSISVDAASSGNPGKMEYQGVITKTKELIFHKGPFEYSTNNIGEFLALVHALAYLKQQSKEDITIYTDSKTAIAWVRNKAIKSTLDRNHKNETSFELVDRAISWLKNNTFNNPIVKWETEVWGEIPADFGRK